MKCWHGGAANSLFQYKKVHALLFVNSSDKLMLKVNYEYY